MKLFSKRQQQILDLLKRNGRMSVDQVTAELDGVKTAARRALLSLERRDILTREWIPTPRGRPQLAFSLRSESGQLFSSKEAELLEGLIRFLRKVGLEKVIEDFFADYWDEKYAEVMKRLKSRRSHDLGTRMEILVSVLEDEGFYPRAELNKEKGLANLKECHCPISSVAKTTSIPCKMESRFIAKVLNAKVDQIQRCEFSIRKKANR